MAVEDVKSYFKLLLTDEEFVKAMFHTGEDKAAKMKLIRQKGLEFTKDEYLQVVEECRREVEASGMLGDIAEGKVKISDECLDNVSAAGLLGGIFGLAIGGGVGALAGLGGGLLYASQNLSTTGGAGEAFKTAATIWGAAEAGFIGGALAGGIGGATFIPV